MLSGGSFPYCKPGVFVSRQQRLGQSPGIWRAAIETQILARSLQLATAAGLAESLPLVNTEWTG